MNILIAEDERITRQSLKRQLERWGHHVVAAEDGAEAWQQFQQQQFDIVVTDWDMPHIDGRQLVELIRSNRPSGYVYLIMLTGRSEKVDLVTGMEAGADDFLSKPFDRNELHVRLNAGERIIQLERELTAQNERLTEANKRMKRDLDAAADIQQDLLPMQLPETLKADFDWHYQPCDELGGDILNVLPLDEQHIAMYLLDVSGHGVPAALLSVTLSRVLTTHDPAASILMTQNDDPDAISITAPSRVVEHLNQQFPMSAQRDRYFTLAYAVLDVDTGVLRYVLAGQPAPFLVRQNQAPKQLDGDGFPVGILDGAEFDEYSLQLEPGDRLFFYSDGITEATNDRGMMLKVEGFARLIEQTRAKPLNECLATCIEAFKHWCNGSPLDDDISVLLLEMPDVNNH